MILRPPGGFKVTLSPGVQALVSEAIVVNPDFEQHWKDIVDRLRFTAHVEGVADSRFGKGHRLFAAAADEDRKLPRVKLVYSVLGANVRIRVAAIG